MVFKRMPLKKALAIVFLIFISLTVIAAQCGARSAAPPAQVERTAKVAPPFQAEAGNPMGEAAAGQPVQPPQALPATEGNAMMDTFSGEVNTALQQAQAPRMIIYSGNLALVVKNTEETISTIRAIAESQGGFISGSNLYRTEGTLQGTITVRIPSDKFFNTIDEIKKLAIRVERENNSTNDVTEEYTDLTARKKNLEVAEKALQDLLEQRQRTGSTADILEVYRELTSVRGQIEQIQGRMNYLARLSALSSIEISLMPDILAQPINVGGWQPQGTLKEAVQALIKAMQVIVDASIWIIVLIVPLLIVFLLPLLIIVALIRRWLRKRQAKKAAKAEAIVKEG